MKKQLVKKMVMTIATALALTACGEKISPNAGQPSASPSSTSTGTDPGNTTGFPTGLTPNPGVNPGVNPGGLPSVPTGGVTAPTNPLTPR